MVHQTEEQLEFYALGRLTETQVAAVEEHLLVCSVCQDKLDEVEAYALAMREAISAEPKPEPQTDWLAWLRPDNFRLPSWSMAAVGGFVLAQSLPIFVKLLDDGRVRTRRAGLVAERKKLTDEWGSAR